MLIAVAIAILALAAGFSAVCVAKGKPFFALFVFGFFGTIAGAIRLAKPDSWWARRFYAPEKVEQARARFAEDDALTADRDSELLAAWDGVEINPDELDPITKRALKRAGRI